METEHTIVRKCKYLKFVESSLSAFETAVSIAFHNLSSTNY